MDSLKGRVSLSWLGGFSSLVLLYLCIKKIGVAIVSRKRGGPNFKKCQFHIHPYPMRNFRIHLHKTTKILQSLKGTAKSVLEF